MAVELRTLSQSSLQDYNDCPRRFELRYVQRLSYPAIETEPALEHERHQQEGEYFHRLVQQLLAGIPAEQISKLANTSNLERWWENFSTQAKELELLVDRKPEVSLSAPLGKYRLIAKYDLIGLSKDGRAIIYDWKTYRKRPRNDWLHMRLQTRVYRALLVQAGAHLNQGKSLDAGQVEMVYWFAEFPAEAARLEYQVNQFQRDWETLTRLADEIAAAKTFPQTEDLAKCSYCPYRSYCNRGVQAAQALDVDLESEAEKSFDLNFEQIGEIAF